MLKHMFEHARPLCIIPSAYPGQDGNDTGSFCMFKHLLEYRGLNSTFLNEMGLRIDNSVSPCFFVS